MSTMQEGAIRIHSMATRSMSNKSEVTKSNAKTLKPTVNHLKTDKKRTEDIISEPIAEILTEAELKERGLNPDENIRWRKVIPASELDILVTAGNDVRGKWAVAPEGWYWKEFSKKCYYWFDWYELRKIPKK
jgi:hypothetical protein